MNKVEETGKEAHASEAGDVSLFISFATRRGTGDTGNLDEGLADDVQRQEQSEESGGLIEASDLEEFLATARREFSVQQNKDVLRRALNCMMPTPGEADESYFLKLFSALESALTFFRRENEYDILPRRDFSELERDLKKWLKQHPLLEREPEKRALIYEKVRELNRFPFSHVFKKFCARYDVYLEDLWPVIGQLDGWPLLEIRHRLVHGDPFTSRPAQSLACAMQHLRWTTERMLLSVFNWPIERSNVSPERLARAEEAYKSWPTERARFA